MSDARRADLAAARALFLAHDGSRFHLSREGKAAEFDAYEVPDATTAQWLTDLIDLRLCELDGESGWYAVQSLLNHGELGHLSAVVAHPPVLGKPWQRRAYLEGALRYWDACAGRDASPDSAPEASDHSREALADALRWILEQSRELLGSRRMRGQRDALAELIEAAQTRADGPPDRSPPSAGPAATPATPRTRP